LDNPIKVINERASTLTEDDVDWIVEELMDHFSGRIHSLTAYVYGSERGVSLAAFKEYAAQTLRKGAYTFLFKSQHWRSGRSIGPYIATCLSKLADGLKSDIDFVKKVSIPVCPACKTLGEREFLVHEGRLMRCPTCTKESVRLEAIKERSSREEFEYRIRKVFCQHSRKGHRCPGCDRFIPESFTKASDNGRISCPYDNCDWFGMESELESMTHPLAQSSGMTISMNAPMSKNVSSSTSETELGDMFDAHAVNPDIRMEQSEKYYNELKIARTVLKTQKERLECQSKSKIIKKYMMYKAFETLLDQDPEGMISYLIRGKSLGERPIQSLIFQKYIQLIENSLPFDTINNGTKVEVYSLLDQSLNLFLGTSEYQAYVRESGFVSNNTHEIFVGSKCNGPCFIGWLCDVTDENNNSILSEVEYYTFSSIKMKNTVPQGTLIKVVHFRIPPHYEMYSLVNLQRTRRKIVDSIYKRLHGEVRPLKGSDEQSKIISEISY
jgi:hypothetical protein